MATLNASKIRPRYVTLSDGRCAARFGGETLAIGDSFAEVRHLMATRHRWHEEDPDHGRSDEHSDGRAERGSGD
jgi:hypothetical protein